MFVWEEIITHDFKAQIMQPLLYVVKKGKNK